MQSSKYICQSPTVGGYYEDWHINLEIACPETELLQKIDFKRDIFAGTLFISDVQL
jgi:hypothetical protein